MVDNAAAALKTVFAYLVILACLSDSVLRLFLLHYFPLSECHALCMLCPFEFQPNTYYVLRFIKKYLKIVCVKDMGAGLH